MKIKLLQLSAILFFAAAINVQAQTRVGAGLAYGTEIEKMGINVNSQIFVKENIAIAPGIVYFFPKNLGSGFDFNWFDINLNGHYYFALNSVQPYALAGLNFAILSIDSGFGSANNTEIGLNLGGGVNFLIGGKLIPFGELRIVVGNADQLVFGGGVRLNING